MHEGTPEQPAPTPTPAAPGAKALPSEEELKRALGAFKKRIKLMRLDQESKLGGRAMSAGKKSDIDQIQPPSQFPREVWKELAARKLIRDHGQGFYSMP